MTEEPDTGYLAHYLDIPRYKWIYCLSVSVFVILQKLDDMQAAG